HIFSLSARGGPNTSGRSRTSAVPCEPISQGQLIHERSATNRFGACGRTSCESTNAGSRQISSRSESAVGEQQSGRANRALPCRGSCIRGGCFGSSLGQYPRDGVDGGCMPRGEGCARLT